MHECLLCKRNMKVSNNTFGNGCIKNIYSLLDMKLPKKVKLREETLYKNVMQLTNTHSINKNQKLWLTDRYLTYQYLNRIQYGNYKEIKNQINYDIENIKQIKKDEKPKNLVKYYNDTSSIAKSVFSSTLYNLASFSIKCGVMKEYDIDIKLYIEEFEVL